MKFRSVILVGVVTLLVTLAGTARATNDPEWSQQYGPQQIYAPQAWTKTRGQGVTIAIVRAPGGVPIGLSGP